LENSLQAAAQWQLVAKPLNQKQAPEVGERVRLERKIQCSQALSHVCAAGRSCYRLAPITVLQGRLLAFARNLLFPFEDKPLSTFH